VGMRANVPRERKFEKIIMVEVLIEECLGRTEIDR
jgi:hypothetical protein